MHHRSTLPGLRTCRGYRLRLPFPESPDGETFWQNLLEGRECSDALRAKSFWPSVWMPPSLTTSLCQYRYGVRQRRLLRRHPFGYSRQEAESMDPQQRLFLQRSGMRWNMPVMPPAPSPIRRRFRLFPDEYLPRSRSIERDEVAQVKGLQSLMGNDKDYIAPAPRTNSTCTARRYRYRPPVQLAGCRASGL